MDESPPRRRPFFIAMTGLVVIVVGLVAVASFGFRTLSAVRAYVGGEALWSKAQKSAVADLLRYAHTHEEADYRRYLADLDVPHGDRRARLELDKPVYDARIVRGGFVQGGNAPEDTAGMAELYRRFHTVPYLAKAIAIWRDGDAEIAALEVAGQHVHRVVESGGDADELRAVLAEIDLVNVRATKLEDAFSRTLGEAARWLSDLLVKFLAVTAVIVIGVAGVLLHRLLERLRRTSEAVSATEAAYRALAIDAPVGIGSSLRDGTLVAVNPALVSMLGYANEAALLATKAQDLYVDPEDRTRLLAALTSGEVRPREIAWRRVDGRPLTVRVSVRDVRDAANTPRQSFIVEDVTETRLLQEQVRHAQKMEAVGTLAAGVAHDFNNLLTVILGSASLLRTQLGSRHQALSSVEPIEEAGERAAALTKQLLAFARKQPLAPKLLDLNAIVRDTGKLVRGMVGDRIELTVLTTERALPVRADQGQLEQVLVNLAMNARDAMPNGGTLRLETAVVAAGAVPLDPTLPAATAEHAAVRVSDTGSGIDAAALPHVFEPFFTTKPRGKGTGLGLATVHGIVHQSGGRIRVKSEKDKGTTFEIFLPLSGAEASPSPPAVSPSPRGETRLGASQTLLVVEDQDAVRRLTARVLRAEGYVVLEANGGAEALRVSAAHEGRIDLLVTDVMMPGMNGREVAAALTETRPELGVLYVSGYSGEALDGVLKAGAVLLAKPFSSAELCETVAALLARKALCRD